MSWLSESQDRLPLTWWKGQPIYLAAILAIGGVASMIVTAVLMAAIGSIPAALIFTWSNIADHYRIWTPLTYVLINPPDLMFVITSFFFWRFGEQVERHLGRRVFVKLVVCLALLPPLLLTLIAVTGLRYWPAIGMGQLEFAVFVAFATLYPRAQISLIVVTIEAWIMAGILVGVSALTHLAYHNWPGLFVLAGDVLFAYGYMRYEQGHWHLPTLASLKRRFQRETPRDDASMEPREKSSAVGDAESKVDDILEKIHREGIQSLSDEERRIMEKASEKLRKSGS